MKKYDLFHYLSLMERILKDDIIIGFHSHNNIQSAFSNAQFLMDNDLNHNLIIDSTI